MVYLKSFEFPDDDAEFDFLLNVKRKCYASFYPFKILSRRRFETLTVDTSTVRSDTDLLALIDGEIAAHGYGEETQLRLVLTGFLSSAVALSESAILDHISPSLFYAELVMNTEPLPEGDGLDLDPTVRGAFYNSLRPELESDDPELRRTASDALRYGLSALRGDSIL